MVRLDEWLAPTAAAILITTPALAQTSPGGTSPSPGGCLEHA
jgi:hypothetical protein